MIATKPSRKPEPVAQVSARMKRYRERLSKERRLNREHLAAHGFDGDPESFVSQWRGGKIRVTFEIVEKESDPQNQGFINMEDRVNKPKRKKCPGTGMMSITVDQGVFGIDHICPACGGRIDVTNKNYKEPRPLRLHMVNVPQEVLIRCVECGALLETNVHCDNCGTFHPTRQINS